MDATRCSRLGVLVAVLLGCPLLCLAQQARPSTFAIDSSAALDQGVDENGTRSTGVVLDAVVSADVGAGFQAIVRPFVQRLPSGEWNRQIWVAALRYERRGPLGVRVDGGLIPPPIGLANLTLRPHLNPTIAQPSSLFTPLPPAVLRGRRETLLGAIYPFGAQVTVSGAAWDARGGVIDTSPMRARRVFARTNPPRLANAFVGGGVTPMVGLRLGASVTHGGWLSSDEIEHGRDATVVTVESEFAFRYTRLTGEFVRAVRHGSTACAAAAPPCDLPASGWFVQGQQTLTPRWFLAGRLERMWAPSGVSPVDQRFTGVEQVLGYRLTPEITLRVGHRARESFGQSGFTHQGSVSVVWWKRWI